MITITLTNNEAKILLQLIDIAIKSQGINVAEVGVFFTKKIEEEFIKQTPQQKLSDIAN